MSLPHTWLYVNPAFCSIMYGHVWHQPIFWSMCKTLIMICLEKMQSSSLQIACSLELSATCATKHLYYDAQMRLRPCMQVQHCFGKAVWPIRGRGNMANRHLRRGHRALHSQHAERADFQPLNTSGETTLLPLLHSHCLLEVCPCEELPLKRKALGRPSLLRSPLIYS